MVVAGQLIEADNERSHDRLTCEWDQLRGWTEDGSSVSPCRLASVLVESCSAGSSGIGSSILPVWGRRDSYSNPLPNTRCTCNAAFLKLISVCAICQGGLPPDLRSWESSCGEIGMSRTSAADADDTSKAPVLRLPSWAFSAARLDGTSQTTLNRRSDVPAPATRKWPTLAIVAPIVVFVVLSIVFTVIFFVYRRQRNKETASFLEAIGFKGVDRNISMKRLIRDSDGLIYGQGYDSNEGRQRRERTRNKAFEDAKLHAPHKFWFFSTRKKVRPYKHTQVPNWSIDVDLDDQSFRSSRGSMSSLAGVPPQQHATPTTDNGEYVRLPHIQEATQINTERPVRGVQQKKKPKPIKITSSPEDRSEIMDGLLSRAETSITTRPTHAPRGPRRQSKTLDPSAVANIDVHAEESWTVVDPNNNTIDSNHATRDSNSVIMISGIDQDFTISSQSHATTSEGHVDANLGTSAELPKPGSRSPSRSPNNSPSPRAFTNTLLPVDRTSAAALVPVVVRAAGYSPGQKTTTLPSTSGTEPMAAAVLSNRQSVSTSGPPTSSAEYTVPNPFTSRHTKIPSDETPRQHYQHLTSTSGSANTRPVELPNLQTTTRPRRYDTIDEYTERNPFIKPSGSPRPPPPPAMSNIDDASTRAAPAESVSASTQATSDAATSSVEYTVPNPFTHRSVKRSNPPVSRSGMFAVKNQNADAIQEHRESTHYTNLESFAMPDRDNDTSEGAVSSPTGIESIPESAAAPSSNELDPSSSTSEIGSSIVRAFPVPPPLSSVIGIMRNAQRGRGQGLQPTQTSNSSDYSVPNPFTKRAQLQRQVASDGPDVASANPFSVGGDVERTPKRHGVALLE